jgi:hypothetical protein
MRKIDTARTVDGRVLGTQDLSNFETVDQVFIRR